jgi:hypothetical protein
LCKNDSLAPSFGASTCKGHCSRNIPLGVNPISIFPAVGASFSFRFYSKPFFRRLSYTFFPAYAKYDFLKRSNHITVQAT